MRCIELRYRIRARNFFLARLNRYVRDFIRKDSIRRFFSWKINASIKIFKTYHVRLYQSERIGIFTGGSFSTVSLIFSREIIMEKMRW